VEGCYGSSAPARTGPGQPLKLGLGGLHSACRGGYRVIYCIGAYRRRVDVVAIGKEVPMQPRLWRDPVGTTLRGTAVRFTTTRICRIGTILSPAGWRSGHRPGGAEAPSAGHVVGGRA
jgi:hypothetical protein